MKTRTNLVATMMAASIAAVASVNAHAGQEGKGTNVVILPDDRVVLADPYMARVGSPSILAAPLEEGLERIALLAEAYGMNPKVAQAPLNPNVEYRFVSALPQNDACTGKEKYGIPTGATDERVACTDGLITWIREDLFKRMSVRHQAATLFHERLHEIAATPPGAEDFTVRPRIAHEFIADLTEGADTLLEIHNLQLNRQKPILSPDQMSVLQRFRRRIDQTGIAGQRDGLYLGSGLRDIGARSWDFDFQITPQGGGLIMGQRASVHPTAYVDLLSKVLQGTIEAGATIRASRVVSAAARIAENAEIADSQIKCGLVVESGARVSGLVFSPKEKEKSWMEDEPCTGVIHSGATIQAAELNAGNLDIAAGATIREAKLHADTISVAAGATVNATQLTAGNLALEQNAQLENVQGLADPESWQYGPKMRTMLRIGANARFANVVDFKTYAVEGRKTTLIWMTGFYPAELQIKPGSQIDFGGRAICDQSRYLATGTHKYTGSMLSYDDDYYKFVKFQGRQIVSSATEMSSLCWSRRR